MTKPLPDALAHLRFLTMKQVCEITTYTPQHIYRMMRQNRFVPCVRLGQNRVAFRVEDIERWVSERQTIRPANDNEPIKD